MGCRGPGDELGRWVGGLGGLGHRVWSGQWLEREVFQGGGVHGVGWSE